MHKTYVLDTNVILHDPQSIFKFEEHTVVIPITVIEELDTFKKNMNELGRNARYFSKVVDELRETGSLLEGVKLTSEGGKLKVFILSDKDYKTLPHELDLDVADNRILAAAYLHKNSILVSKDTNMRLKADALGIQAETYENDAVECDTLYSGVITTEEGYLPPLDILSPNQFVQVKGGNEQVMSEFIYKNGELQHLREDLEAWGLKPRNAEQRFAMQLLLDDDIKLVTLVGESGVGKTLAAIACALRKVTDEFVYRKLLVSRPVMPMGRDIGFLPGPQPLDAKVLTPDGWTIMGELTIGDRVITRAGKAAVVVGIYPKGIKKVFKVTTTEGTSTECCEDHLWFTTTSENRKRGKKGSVKSTKQIKDTLYNKFGKLNHHLPRNEAVQYNEVQLPLSPYVLGVILGDGSISNTISFSSKDQDIVDKVTKEVAPLGCSVVHSTRINYSIRGNTYNNKPARSVCLINEITGEVKIYNSIGIALQDIDINRSTLHNRCHKNLSIAGVKYLFLDNKPEWSNPVKDIIFKLGLEGTKAPTKFIPHDYLYNSSIESRLELLRGLMDTDGTVKINGEASYCTTSLQLAKDVVTLVQSLGGRAKIKSRDRRNKQSIIDGRVLTTKLISYEFNISLPEKYNPFYLPRKAERFKSAYMHGVCIESIEEVGEKPVQCIMIDDPEHLYITDDFLVTHNTIEDKLMPYMAPIVDNIEYLMNGYVPEPDPPTKKRGRKKLSDEKDEGLLSKGYQELVAAGILDVEPLLYIRGRSIPKQFLIVDEAQNLTPHEVKTIITRSGEGTKIVLTGDPTQLDHPYLDASSNGLTYVVEKFKNESIAGHVTLTQGERSELATLAAKIL